MSSPKFCFKTCAASVLQSYKKEMQLAIRGAAGAELSHRKDEGKGEGKMNIEMYPLPYLAEDIWL